MNIKAGDRITEDRFGTHPGEYVEVTYAGEMWGIGIQHKANGEVSERPIDLRYGWVPWVDLPQPGDIYVYVGGTIPLEILGYPVDDAQFGTVITFCRRDVDMVFAETLDQFLIHKVRKS